MTLIDALKADLALCEGKKAFVYDDANGLVLTRGVVLKGNPTIGVGRALNKRPLSDNEIDFLLTNDCDDTIDWCTNNLSWFQSCNDRQQRAICNMVFQLGKIGFLNFSVMIAYMKQKDWGNAQKAALNSDWARQVPSRAKFVTELFV